MNDNLSYLINILGKLKELQRTGWINKGIENAETVAAHSHGVALLALLFVPQHLNKEKCLKLALIHDIQEALVGDITPFDGVSEEEKVQREKAAVKEISQKLHFAELEDLFAEYEENKTKEARFIKDMDRLDAVLEAIYYDNGNKTQEKIFNEFYSYANTHTNKDELITKQLFNALCKL